MYNLNEKGKEKSVLDELFECREENLCVITETDKKRLKELIKDNNTYQMLLALMKMKNFIRYGFADAMNLVLACIKQQ